MLPLLHDILLGINDHIIGAAEKTARYRQKKDAICLLIFTGRIDFFQQIFLMFLE